MPPIQLIRVAPLRESEYVPWTQLWSAYKRFYGVDLPAEVTAATWRRLQDGRVHGLGARNAAGELLGIVHFLFHEDTWSTRSACYLQDLYVEPTVRGTGCGRQLIEAVVEAAKAAGANSPYWLTHETNSVARRLYDRLAVNQGFIQYTYAPPAGSVR
ncbi:MAG: GNAT family N-acetyltransferase [Steroidobacteraceae bacterium]|jgi:GNAT superfamily N-acetyltransferase